MPHALHSAPRALAAACLLAACPQFYPPQATDGDDDTTGDPATTTTTSDDPTTGGPPTTERILHYFGALALPPRDDDAGRCASWRLNNEAALYVQAVQLVNEGMFHHSNWIVVPEDAYPGADGFWSCAERGFEEVSAAQTGTVLFAQSTQSYSEEQRLTAGAVIKIPPRHKIVGLLHTLNSSPREASSGLWLGLDLLHPRDVDVVVSPLTMQYRALEIPAEQESRFTGVCDLSVAHAAATLQPLALRLHYILPHYHYLGNYFDVSVVGGALDGQSVYQLSGFNGEGNGKTFDPPLDLPGATGLRFTCGYDNWRNQSVQWGNGDGEMCVLLALVESAAVLGASVESFNHIVDVVDDIHYYEGACLSAGLAKHPNQAPPTAAERDAPLYLPPAEPGEPPPPPPGCRDIADDAAPETPTTLTSIRDSLFLPSCGFSACHGQAAAAGLDLTAADLHAELLHHASTAGIPLVVPGDPDASWLYRVLSRCAPEDAEGEARSHMPLNAPFLLDEALVAKVRAWISAGAKDD